MSFSAILGEFLSYTDQVLMFHKILLKKPLAYLFCFLYAFCTVAYRDASGSPELLVQAA